VHREGDITASRCCRVHEAAEALLHGSDQLRIALRGERERVGDVLEEVGRVGQGAALHFLKRTVRKEAFDELLDVGRLVQFDRAVCEVVYLDAEEVLHGALVGDVPVAGERVHEGVVGTTSGAAAVGVEHGGVHDLKVVDVHADGDDLAVRVNASEHARVGVIEGGEALCD
jgi:hypothetical protein